MRARAEGLRSGARGEFDCLIVGAGVVGSVMAGLLLARGQVEPGRVGIIAERSLPDPASARPIAGSAAQDDWGLRVFALSRASQRLLEICGVWQTLPERMRCAYERMCVWDGAASLSFDSAAVGEPNLGYIVEGRVLQAQCRRAAASAGAVFIDAALDNLAVTDTEAHVSLADGRELRAQLLVGADGAESTTRDLLGIGLAGRSYRQEALVAHVQTAKTHRSTAWQRFLPTGPLAFLPLPDGRSSIVWSATQPEADRLRGLDVKAFGTALTAASDDVLGSCSLTTAIASFPLKLQYAVDYVRPRAVLVGDAAHSVHPLAGQGLNMGLMDCASLSAVLEGESAGEHRLLRRYERWRRSENLLAAAAMDGLERLFSSANPWIGQMRSAGMTAVGAMPMIKRRFVERALGLSGDVPPFLFATADRALRRR